jgi:hypothetical protein
MLLPCAASAQNIVGLREPHRDVFMAVRGLVPAATRVSGIEFISNDATVFPEVFLARDAVAGRLPAPGVAVRSSGPIQGQPGTTSVDFDLYEPLADEYLWAAVRFPDAEPLVAGGPGGGPGIGWRAERLLPEERSLFSVGGALNEFSPAFAIRLRFEQAGATQKTNPGAENSREEVASLWLRVVPRGSGDDAAVAFRVRLAHAGDVHIELFDVAGRRVVDIQGVFTHGGEFDLVWEGRDSRRRRMASGVYFYALRSTQTSRSGKFVFVR